VDFWIFSLKLAFLALRINNLIYLAKLDGGQRSLGIRIALIKCAERLTRYLKKGPSAGP
jgi:hypothetical protein